MNQDSIRLLEECSSGCKMGINSMEQIKEYAKDDGLRQVIEDYKEKHEEIEEKTVRMLIEFGKPEKDPGAVASAFSWLTAEMKLMIQNDSSHIAKLLMNGINMGIQTITEHMNQYAAASEEAVQVAEELVRAEEDFRDKLKPFL